MILLGAERFAAGLRNVLTALNPVAVHCGMCSLTVVKKSIIINEPQYAFYYTSQNTLRHDNCVYVRQRGGRFSGIRLQTWSLVFRETW